VRITRAVHFVTCNGELLLAVLFHDLRPSFTEVYKPDLTPGRIPGFGERVTDFGGYSLFQGRGDKFALSTEDFPAIEKNSVYYVVHILNYDVKDWVFVSNLESVVLDRFLFQEHKEDPTNQWWRVSWFCPRSPIFSPNQQFKKIRQNLYHLLSRRKNRIQPRSTKFKPTQVTTNE
jgi:hypothetical protein